MPANILDEIGLLIEDGIVPYGFDAKIGDLCKKSFKSFLFYVNIGEIDRIYVTLGIVERSVDYNLRSLMADRFIRNNRFPL
jgi:hypothetical protein